MPGVSRGCRWNATLECHAAQIARDRAIPMRGLVGDPRYKAFLKKVHVAQRERQAAGETTHDT